MSCSRAGAVGEEKKGGGVWASQGCHGPAKDRRLAACTKWMGQTQPQKGERGGQAGLERKREKERTNGLLCRKKKGQPEIALGLEKGLQACYCLALSSSFFMHVYVEKKNVDI